MKEEEEQETTSARGSAEWHSDRADIVEQQLNPSRTIGEVKANLLGTTFAQDKEGAWFVGIPNEKKRVFTDEGVNEVISYLESLLSSQVALSNLRDTDPEKFALAFANDLAVNMTVNWNRWFAKKFVDDPSLIEGAHNRVKFQLTLLVYAHLTRAIDATTHQGIVDMSKRIEHSQIIQREEMPQSTGWMNKLKGIKMR